jgi:hypothetical protein
MQCFDSQVIDGGSLRTTRTLKATLLYRLGALHEGLGSGIHWVPCRQVAAKLGSNLGIGVCTLLFHADILLPIVLHLSMASDCVLIILLALEILDPASFAPVRDGRLGLIGVDVLFFGFDAERFLSTGTLTLVNRTRDIRRVDVSGELSVCAESLFVVESTRASRAFLHHHVLFL